LARCYDLAANLLEVPLHQLFGGRLHAEIPICRMLASRMRRAWRRRPKRGRMKGYRAAEAQGAPARIAEDVARVRDGSAGGGDTVRWWSIKNVVPRQRRDRLL